ncbi:MULTISPECIES: hypothetical protein [unclassified Brachybacterium]|uniref:hypothetical protein n=3 Tax=Brachybacterium TaxID=43668 RepID=UPI00402A68CA
MTASRSTLRTVPPRTVPLRPARRSVLLSGALLVPLGLAGCDPERDGPPEELSAPTLNFEPMTSDEKLLPEQPMLEDSWNISPTDEHPLAVLVSRTLAQERDLFVITREQPRGIAVPIDPATTGLAVDRHAATVGVLASTVVDAEHRQQLWSSADLADWTAVEVTGIDREIAAFGGGIVASAVNGRTVAVWELPADGTAAALTALEVPEGVEWEVLDVARNNAAIVLLVTARDAAGTEAPAILASQDSGATWAEPQVLPDDGKDAVAMSVSPLGEGFVVIGSHEPASDDGAYMRPTAWVSPDGTSFTQEEIPLPAFGLDGWTRSGEKIPVDDPIDWGSFGASPAVVDAKTGTVHFAAILEDDCRCATRSAEGTWTVSDMGDFVGHTLTHGAATPDSQILLGETSTYAREGGGGSLALGLPFTIGRNYIRLIHDVHNGIDAVIQGYRSFVDKSSTHSSTSVASNLGVSIRDGGFVLAEDFPQQVEEWDWGRVHRLPDGVEILSGREEDEDGNGQLLSLARGDGEWVDTEGLEIPGLYMLGSTSIVDETSYLSGAGTIADQDGSALGGVKVLSSSDGLTWEQVGSGPDSPSEDPAFGGGGYITTVASVDGVLIGLGTAVAEDGPNRAATFVLTVGVWTPRVIEDIPPGLNFGFPYLVGDTVHVLAAGYDRVYHGVLAADGSCTRTYLSSDQEQRDMLTDLGGGALLASGWSRTASAFGACVWASRDGGETWAATVLPEHEGRFPRVDLARDGEDVVVIAGHDDAPVGFKIIGAQKAVLPDTGSEG